MRGCVVWQLMAKKIKINGEAIFQRLVLDQGYYPDGVMTAPTDQALIDDIRNEPRDVGFQWRAFAPESCLKSVSSIMRIA